MSSTVNCDLRIYFDDHEAAAAAEELLRQLEDGEVVPFGDLALDSSSIELSEPVERHDTWVLLNFAAERALVESVVRQIPAVFAGSDADAAVWTDSAPERTELISLRDGRIAA